MGTKENSQAELSRVCCFNYERRLPLAQQFRNKARSTFVSAMKFEANLVSLCGRNPLGDTKIERSCTNFMTKHR